MTFSPYNRGGSINKHPRYTVKKLSDYGWYDTGETVDGYRPVFQLAGTDALLYREQGGCVVDVGEVVKFFPPAVSFAEVTEWAREMSSVPFEAEPMCPELATEVDTYGLEARG